MIVLDLCDEMFAAVMQGYTMHYSRLEKYCMEILWYRSKWEPPGCWDAKGRIYIVKPSVKLWKIKIKAAR